MPVYLAALVIFGLYLSAVPVKFALTLRLDGRVGFGAGASLFEGRFALKRARLRASGRKKHLPWRRAKLDLEKCRAAAGILRRLLGETRLESLRLSGRVGLHDAARTALACGFARAAGAALSAALAPGAVRFDVEPDFSGGGCALELAGIFSLSAGQIMLGALRGAIEFARERSSGLLDESLPRRVREWTGIPLRTS